MKNIRLKISFFALVLLMISCSEDEVPMPVATATPASQIINSGESTSIALTSTISGTSFSWTAVQTGVSGASSGSGSTIVQALTITGTTSGNATYTITPTANGLVGNPITVVVTVNLLKTTYVSDVKPILTTSCTPCHMAGGSNPNKWDEYASAKSSISSILDRVKRDPGATGFMPRNGAKLSADKIAILEKWVADGLLEN